MLFRSLLRRDWQERVGLFDETLRSYEDWDLWLRLARAGCPMGWVPRPVSQYRFHLAQMTRIGRQMTTATFAVLEKTFSDPSLPAAWRARKDAAYSRAYLRAAAQAYTASAFDLAEDCMRRAVAHDPGLVAADAQPIADIVAGWANHVKTADAMGLLEGVYDHLPAELAALRARRSRDLAREALQLTFAAYQRGDRAAARTFVRRAVGLQPRAALDRGVLSILLRTFIPGTGATAGGDTPASARWVPGSGRVPSEGNS